jgi:hypothetical protein
VEDEDKVTQPGWNVEGKATSDDQFDGSELVGEEHYEDSTNENSCGKRALVDD